MQAWQIHNLKKQVVATGAKDVTHLQAVVDGHTRELQGHGRELRLVQDRQVNHAVTLDFQRGQISSLFDRTDELHRRFPTVQTGAIPTDVVNPNDFAEPVRTRQAGGDTGVSTVEHAAEHHRTDSQGSHTSHRSGASHKRTSSGNVVAD